MLLVIVLHSYSDIQCTVVATLLLPQVLVLTHWILSCYHNFSHFSHFYHHLLYNQM